MEERFTAKKLCDEAKRMAVADGNKEPWQMEAEAREVSIVLPRCFWAMLADMERLGTIASVNDMLSQILIEAVSETVVHVRAEQMAKVVAVMAKTAGRA